MHPQHPWMMRVNAEEMQRDVERRLRIREARGAANLPSNGLVGNVRRVIGLALISAGSWIQPAPRPAREYDAGLEIELAR